MKIVKVAMLLFAALLMLHAGELGAASQSGADTPTSTRGKVIKGGPFRVGEIVGKKVENPDGEVIGEITDMVAGQDGNIQYAVLNHGGFLGIGDKLVPIPWEAVKRLPDDNRLLVNVTKGALEKAPNFEPDKWPDFSEPAWNTEVRQYYVIQGTVPDSRGKKSPAGKE